MKITVKVILNGRTAQNKGMVTGVETSAKQPVSGKFAFVEVEMNPRLGAEYAAGPVMTQLEALILPNDRRPINGKSYLVQALRPICKAARTTL